MARTRGASAPVVHVDNGELVAPPPKAPLAQPRPSAGERIGYYCSRKTWRRDMDGWEAAALVDMLLRAVIGESLAASMTEASYRRLPPDLRRHFAPLTEQIRVTQGLSVPSDLPAP